MKIFNTSKVIYSIGLSSINSMEKNQILIIKALIKIFKLFKKIIHYIYNNIIFIEFTYKFSYN
jgi:hypothetical protein